MRARPSPLFPPVNLGEGVSRRPGPDLAAPRPGVPEDSQGLDWLPHGTDGRCLPGSRCLQPRSPLLRAGPWRRVRAAGLRSKLNNLRRFGRLPRDLFSRASPPLARKSLIFLDPLSAVQPPTSDNGQSVNFPLGYTCWLFMSYNRGLPRGQKGDSDEQAER